jgi:hemolysin activation/secretion protein
LLKPHHSPHSISGTDALRRDEPQTPRQRLGRIARNVRSDRTKPAVFAVAAAATFGCALAAAQTPPDAGSLLQQIEQQQHATLPPKSAPQFEPPPPMQSLGGATVVVKTFHFAGNHLLTDAALAAVVKPFADRPLTFTELQNAAIAVATAYRRADYVVRAYLPKQEIADGIVTIQIVEAKFGAVQVEGHAARVADARLQAIVAASQPSGAAVNAAALDRALLLIGDVPGVSATGRLSEGRKQAETDLVLSVSDGALLTGDVTVDNGGARSTGAGRVIVDAGLNSPLGFGDRVDGVFLYSQGSNYERLAYSVPVGSNGWRVGANASHLDYKVVTSDFAKLDAHGTSTTAGVEAKYPLVRSRMKNLYVAFDLDDKRFDNVSAGATTSRYGIQSASAGLYGNLFDTVGGGGANTASLTLQEGRLDLSGSPNEAADALTTRAAGSFEKARFAAGRQQSVTDRLSLYAGVSGQVAGKNLDSSEKFYLGGSDGVRAYPVNEAGGAQGLALNLEARERLPANFAGTEFFDWGAVHVNQNNAIAGAASPNSQQLKGAGLSVAWTASFGLSLKATVAHRIGHNPNPTSLGDDQDGSLIEDRVWLQAIMPFSTH